MPFFGSVMEAVLPILLPSNTCLARFLWKNMTLIIDGILSPLSLSTSFRLFFLEY